MHEGLTKRSQNLVRWGALQAERSSWFTHWQDISRVLLPRNGRFLVTDRNKGDKRHNNIYDATGTRALRTLAAGMMAGMTSPARPWFRLAIPDRDLMEYQPVKTWLNAVTMLMRDVFAKSNTYRSLHSLYEETGGFGTGANIILPHFENVIHNYPLTIGEYALSTNAENEVDTLYREFGMTVSQMVGEFVYQGNRYATPRWDAVSSTVKNLWDGGRSLDSWVNVLHVIEPRRDRDTRRRDARNMPWRSCYMELQSNEDKYLRESGFPRFPAVCPRWATSGGDIYGNCPGMEALGHIKQLQHQQFRKGQAIDYQVKPPLQMPTALKHQARDTLPGGAAYVDTSTPNGGIRTQFDVNLNLSYLLQDIQDVRQGINSAFYADLFLMISQSQKTGDTTAREIAELHEEKLLMLGPTTERHHNELLEPLIDIAFDRIVEVGALPEPPPELQDAVLNVDFVSPLAQAQRMVGVGAVDRYVSTIGTIASFQFKAGQSDTALDKLDADQVADVYGDMLGVDPSLIVADEKVAIVRQQRAQARQASQMAAMLPEGARAARDLSQADTESKNALTDALGRLGAA